MKRAKDLHARPLLVHGTFDDNVHPPNTWYFVDELVKAGKPVERQRGGVARLTSATYRDRSPFRAGRSTR